MNRRTIALTCALLCSACGLFTSSASSNTPASDDPASAPPSDAKAEAADPPVDYSGLSDAAAHPALAHYLMSVHHELTVDREEVTTLWAVDIGHTAKTDTDPVAIYLYAAHRSLDNAARIVEHCGAPRMAAKLREVEPFGAPADAKTPASEVAGWGEAGQSEAESKPGRELDQHQAKGCVADVTTLLGPLLAAASEIAADDPHRAGTKVVQGWAQTTAYAQRLGSPWPPPEQATRELAAFDHFVRTGKRKELAAVKAKPVHPALILYMEAAARLASAPGRCELLAHDRSDTARGTNLQVLTYASNVVMRTFPELLEACEAPNAAEAARKRLPKRLDRPEDVDRVFEALAPIADDQESPERFCVEKAALPLRETLGATNEALSYKKQGINQSVPYAENAFSQLGYVVEQAETTQQAREELATALLVDAIAQLRKWKRRPAKDLRRFDD